MRTFYEWLLKQQYRDDQIGKLAKDFARDPLVPEKKTKKTLLNHLIFWNATEEIFEAFEMAWQEYKKFRNVTNEM